MNNFSYILSFLTRLKFCFLWKALWATLVLEKLHKNIKMNLKEKKSQPGLQKEAAAKIKRPFELQVEPEYLEAFSQNQKTASAAHL